MYKINELPTPCFVIDEGKLEENLKILHQVEERTGAKILLAQKCFSCFSEYPLIGKYISGTTASGLYEARLGKEEMGRGESCVFSGLPPAGYGRARTDLRSHYFQFRKAAPNVPPCT